MSRSASLSSGTESQRHTVGWALGQVEGKSMPSLGAFCLGNVVIRGSVSFFSSVSQYRPPSPPPLVSGLHCERCRPADPAVLRDHQSGLSPPSRGPGSHSEPSPCPTPQPCWQSQNCPGGGGEKQTHGLFRAGLADSWGAGPWAWCHCRLVQVTSACSCPVLPGCLPLPHSPLL